MIKSSSNSRFRVLSLIIACGWSACVDDPTEEPAPDSGLSVDDAAATAEDAELDAGEELDATEEDASVPSPRACKESADCEADEFCHEDGFCKRTIPPECAACTKEHPCDLEQKVCDCGFRKGDADGDGYAAIVCGGRDCDDGNVLISPDADEVCDFSLPSSLTADEDCDPATVAFKATGDVAFRAVLPEQQPLTGDADGDGYISTRCSNMVPSGKLNAGTDCKDNDPNVHKQQTEACNGYDDNCNELTDELADQDAGVDGPAVYIDGGLLQPFYWDRDKDQHGAIDGGALYFCPNVQPRDMVSKAGEPSDADDADPAVFHEATEICDGQNNETGAPGDAANVQIPISIPSTDFACVNGKIEISKCPSPDLLWCHTRVQDGCVTDANALTSCHDCQTDCKFGCGTAGCDALADLRVGSEFSCALGAEGRVACWGNVGNGRLGHQTTNRANVPMWLPRIEQAHGLVLGELHACAIVGVERTLWCWGANANGQLGTLENLVDSAAPLQVRTGDQALSGVTTVAAGPAHTCALVQGGVKCWGSQADGRLGNRVTASSLPRGFADALRGSRRISDANALGVGRRHTCIVSASVGAECWGDNSGGQLGVGSIDAATFGAHPVLGLPGTPSALAVGSDHACTLHSGNVFCWGSNALGQLGPRAADAPANVASQVLGLEDASEIVAGGGVTCALRAGGAPVCWGSNSFGQLGVATSQVTARTLVPLVGSLTEIARIRIGATHACAIAGDGASTCWGLNSYAELGAGRAALGPDLRFAPVLAVQGQGS